MGIIARVLHKLLPDLFRFEKHTSFSQAGEDAVVRFLFNDKKEYTVRYLDLGTSLPVQGNNTYQMYRAGNRGVCVEADTSLIPLIKKERPKDTVLNAGVTFDDSKEADFFIFNERGINTFDREEAIKRSQSGQFNLLKTVKVPLLNVNTIIAENFNTAPDFLSIDIEGLDLKVLQHLDFNKYPIKVICVETCMYSENHIRKKDHSIKEFLTANGYEVYADTYINTIFVHKQWFYG